MENKIKLIKYSASILSITLIFTFIGSSHGLQAKLKDPTLPTHTLAVQKTDQQQWILNSILHAPQRRIAIINGKSLTTGDTINNAQIIAINKDTVKLGSNKKAIILTLKSRKIKEPR
ncbi:MAG: hypothetical protein GXP22_09910 [Gammaproteobacteria bacterium]|nr:hypothetical protein [Gammaproteobacteria bacterium]